VELYIILEGDFSFLLMFRRFELNGRRQPMMLIFRMEILTSRRKR